MQSFSKSSPFQSCIKGNWCHAANQCAKILIIEFGILCLVTRMHIGHVNFNRRDLCAGLVQWSCLEPYMCTFHPPRWSHSALPAVKRGENSSITVELWLKTTLVQRPPCYKHHFQFSPFSFPYIIQLRMLFTVLGKKAVNHFKLMSLRNTAKYHCPTMNHIATVGFIRQHPRKL